MKKQTVCSVLLIFLFMMVLLFAGLNLCEQGLRDVSGGKSPAGAFTVARVSGETLLITFAGSEYSFEHAYVRDKLLQGHLWLMDRISSRLSAQMSGAIMNWKLTGGSKCSGKESGIFP